VGYESRNRIEHELNLKYKNYVSGCGSDVQYILIVGQCMMDCIKLEFNDRISLYKKNDSERRRFVTRQFGYFILSLFIIDCKLN